MTLWELWRQMYACYFHDPEYGSLRHAHSDTATEEEWERALDGLERDLRTGRCAQHWNRIQATARHDIATWERDMAP